MDYPPNHRPYSPRIATQPQVQGPDGLWEEWSTMGEIMLDYDGFEVIRAH